ncbi:MAG: hypothetical protein ABIH23_08685 [bacterium]
MRVMPWLYTILFFSSIYAPVCEADGGSLRGKSPIRSRAADATTARATKSPLAELKPLPSARLSSQRAPAGRSAQEIWDGLSEAAKTELAERLLNVTERLLSHRDVEIAYGFDGGLKSLPTGNARITSASDAEIHICFTLPHLQISGIYRLDVDIPNDLEWEDDFKSRNIWADAIDRTGVEGLMPKWRQVQDFLPNVPRAALSVICEATRLSATGTVECHSQAIIWTRVTKENVPYSQACMRSEIKLEVINETIVRAIHVISDTDDPPNPWLVSEAELARLAYDHLKQKFPKDPTDEDRASFEKLKTTSRHCTRVAWVRERWVDGIITLEPRNAIEVVFGYGDSEWASVSLSLPLVYVDATTGEIYTVDATGHELHQHFLHLAEDLREGRAVVFE